MPSPPEYILVGIALFGLARKERERWFAVPALALALLCLVAGAAEQLLRITL